MANNVLLIGCKGCGECLKLAKHMAGEWYSPTGFSDKSLDVFFENHFLCEERGRDEHELSYVMTTELDPRITVVEGRYHFRID